jgi:hypothetical protein
MKLKSAVGVCATLLFSVFTSACFTIEKEIFLHADGSGELVLHVSLPDLPEKMNETPGVLQTNATVEIDKFKKDVMTKLPETVKLKEAKQVKQNGVLSFYAVLEFKNLKDTEAIFSEFGKSNLNEFSKGSASQWTSQLEQKDGRTTFTERILMDVSEPSKTLAEPARPPATKNPPAAKGRTTASKSKVGGARTKEPPPGFASAKPPEIANDSRDFEEQMKPLFLSLVSMRVVLHAPAAIRESNADLVFGNHRIAVWNCSLIKFFKDKKPIEIKATF